MIKLNGQSIELIKIVRSENMEIFCMVLGIKQAVKTFKKICEKGLKAFK